MITNKLDKIYLVVLDSNNRLVRKLAFKRNFVPSLRSKKTSVFVRLSNYLIKKYPKQYKFYIVGLNRPEIFSVLEFTPGTNSSPVSKCLKDAKVIFDLDSNRMYTISNITLL